ncbi:MAG TPA: HEAT repeat domain-containing protein [Myxococcota bacterium]|nr:HEAT repeat domain-containing protein [Myxococcota bacterium]
MRNTASAEEIAPLVLELARALRARRVHPSGHPVVAGALQRGAAILGALAGSDSQVAFEVVDSGLAQRDGTLLGCPGAPELAAELRARGITGMCLEGLIRVEDLTHLVETLTRAPEELRKAGGARRVFEAGQPRGISLELSEPAAAAPAPVTPPAPRPAPAAVAAPVTAPRPAEAAPPAKPAAEPPSFLTQHIAELVRLLAELERCDDFGGYNLLANKVDTCVDALVRAKRCLDGYRAAVVFCRHATDREVRPEPLRREAADRLRRMACNDAMLEAIIEQATTASGLASVQATQVLIAIGVPAVSALLAHCAGAKDASRERAAQTLIAMGDDALAAVVDELRCGVSERARRAARLLGEMQNPRGIQFLADSLRASDVAVAREAARALARVGTDAAVAALVAGLRLAQPVAETCASCLGGMRQASAARALGDLLDLERDFPDGLRREAIRSLGRLASIDALNRLKRVLDHAPFFGRTRFRSLRIAAAQAIGQIGGPVALQTLHPHARGGDADVRQACQEAIRRIERAAAGT